MKLSRDFITVFIIAVVITTIADITLIVTGYQEREIWGGDIVDYWAVFGMFWYLVIIGFSKWIGHKMLQRREDYYEQKGSDE